MMIRSLTDEDVIRNQGGEGNNKSNSNNNTPSMKILKIKKQKQQQLLQQQQQQEKDSPSFYLRLQNFVSNRTEELFSLKKAFSEFRGVIEQLRSFMPYRNGGGGGTTTMKETTTDENDEHTNTNNNNNKIVQILSQNQTSCSFFFVNFDFQNRR